ncbi:hypothetical protein LTR16_003362 [Cryomyces antarcticus]|uniref:OTU domain-containing protein n=1 Tax=Cryomyces antarcticus TaxID=329879 RepID=A0ABR0M6Y3_9PEZI|nr:hypothetical protein LTR60_002551 [Cryomyces antarcticus]KAK5288537.1 hypothetical protein LTR16_003362 [Cryomyces antarcticus]
MAPRTHFGQRKRRRAKTAAPVATAAQSMTAAPDKRPTPPRTSTPRRRGPPSPSDDDLEVLRDMYTVISRPAPNSFTGKRLREDLDTYSDELEATARALRLLTDQDLRSVDQSRWQLRQEFGHAILEEVRPMTDRHGNALSREDFKKILFLETERLMRQCHSKELQTSDDARAMFETLVNYGSRGWGRELLGGDVLEELQQQCVDRDLEDDGSECELRRRLLGYEVAARNPRGAEEVELRVVTEEDKARRLQREKEKEAAQRLQAKAAELASAEVELAREPRLQGFRFHENIWFHQTKVIGDGSCFWRAFAAAYYRDQEKWTDVKDAARAIWLRAVEDPTDNHVSRRRRTLYQRLDRDSVPSGPPRKDNCCLTDQLTVDGAWCTQEMLQLLADAYNVELFAHFPLNTRMANGRPVAENWGLAVRGVDRQNTNRRQIHLVNYVNAAHWTAVWAEANFQYTDHLIHDQDDPMHLMPTLDDQLGEHAWRPLRRRGSHDSYATDLSASDGGSVAGTKRPGQSLSHPPNKRARIQSQPSARRLLRTPSPTTVMARITSIAKEAKGLVFGRPPTPSPPPPPPPVVTAEVNIPLIRGNGSWQAALDDSEEQALAEMLERIEAERTRRREQREEDRRVALAAQHAAWVAALRSPTPPGERPRDPDLADFQPRQFSQRAKGSLSQLPERPESRERPS